MDLSTPEPKSEIPRHLLSDYVEMTYLGLLLLIGVPINLHVLLKLLKQNQKSGGNCVKKGFLLMKINLNISDILILLINAGGRLGWLITYEWKMGNEMCRVFMYLSIASLYLSSNIVVSIAVDRLKTVLSAQQIRREQNALSTKIILAIAWIMALISSLPQFFAFRVYDILQFSDESWYQCTDICYCICLKNEEQPQPKLSRVNDFTENRNPAQSQSRISMFQDYNPNIGDKTPLPQDEIPMFTWTPTLMRKANDCGNETEKRKNTSGKELQKSHPKNETPKILTNGNQKQPGWRRQLRSRVFKTTLLVVVTHIVFWLPYNFISLLRFVSEDAYTRMRDHMNVFEDMQFLIVLVNPFLYGFEESNSKC
ncbi:hypothetical protein FO519_003741 [Halicephalobus sp. NKZ332]|nr:hypothetical protein FO519_003741 [Halicephalobus sp. NKZ332]